MNAIQEYLESPGVAGLAQSTRELYTYSLAHMEKYMEIKKWNISFSFEDFDMQGFVEYLDDKNLSGKSIQQYLNCVKIFLRWLGFPVQFTFKITNEARQRNKKKHLDRWFTEEEVKACLDYRFDNGDALKYEIIVRLLVETGARVGEISGIQTNDIFIEGQYVLIQGKTEPRPVIFSRETGDLLSELLSMPTLGGKLPAVHIFPSVIRIKSAITRMLTELGMKTSGDGRGGHTFRHHAATSLYYDGAMDITTLAFLLGDKVETIREKYLHPTPAMIRKRVFQAWENGAAARA